ncbi:allantoate amidohydrolase [Paenibacillus sambharensis]|uniref:Allantoate amidohydrolase n=2 Tax=Paenibacillus sambharensis TaxID=1803190 RepID=A0A2W1LDP7_9BACL|nr:allantoate deiminase [Paenibacillus sambharensis]PZD96200.1 allantoate amidohydrolase [Paenibacillus sambharensis]
MRMTMEQASGVTSLLDELAGYGSTADGGVTRLLYSQSWKDAQSFLAAKMSAAGLEVRYDRVGNLFGRMEGSRKGQGVVLTGSHIDTVRSGGRYDGAYGIAASLAAVAFLRSAYGEPRRPLEVVSFCEEEGSRFPLAYWGSGNITGAYSTGMAQRVVDPQGITLAHAMQAAGFGREDQPECLRKDLAAFVEVHVEQGVILERTGGRIGVVETIAGQRRYVVTVKGETNHAGTTPMAMRRDAAAGAAEMIAMLERAANRAGEPLVATVGRMKLMPNIPNVIAGTVEFTLDIRHISETLLTGFSDAVIGSFHSVAERRGLELDVHAALQARPAPMDPVLTGRLEKICSDGGISYRRMMSGAGHDGQMFVNCCPTAMLFVPSKGGVSHSPEEYTAAEDLAYGVVVLAEMLYDLAYEETLT